MLQVQQTLLCQDLRPFTRPSSAFSSIYLTENDAAPMRFLHRECTTRNAYEIYPTFLLTYWAGPRFYK